MRPMSVLNEIVPYSAKHDLPPSYALVPRPLFTPDYRMFALLWFITWPLFLAWLTAKVCFKEDNRADEEEVVRDEPVRETEPVRVADAAERDYDATAAKALEDAMARVVMVSAEAEEAAAGPARAWARAAEAAERERASFAAAEAAEAAADTTLGAVWMPAGEAAAGRAWRAWRADRAASAKAEEEAADAEYELEAAEYADLYGWTVAGGETPH